MYPTAALLAVGAVLCHADLPVTPPVRCGETPTNIYKCLGNPNVISKAVASQCTNPIFSECQRMKCIFEKAGWMAGGAPDKAKVQAHFEQFAKNNPAWAPAVQHVKIDCLTGPLQAQGWEVNCPEYDIMHCTITKFFKNAAPAQWSSSQECAYTRQFAAACPICPESCFSPAIPTGSCNACRLLPRSP